MVPTNAEVAESGGIEARRLQEAVSRLKEVRRRYVLDAGDGESFALAEERLDSIIHDLDGWLKPGGEPVDVDSLGFRMAAVEEMIEAVGFPGHAHVIGGVRQALVEAVEDRNPDDAPPPPRRYEPPPASVDVRRTAEPEVDEWDLREEAERRARGSGRLAKLVLIGGCIAVVWLVFFRPDSAPIAVDGAAEGFVVEEPPAPRPDAPPVRNQIPDPAVAEVAAEYDEENLARFSNEITLAEIAVRSGSTDTALTHFAAAAAIDRHHRRLVEVGGSLIDLLLREADDAFDDTRWEVAAIRVEDARRIARGLYLDTSEIEHVARKHELMTRFQDVTPDDSEAFGSAVGRVVRVTSIYGDVLFGRLESFEDDALLVEIHSGVEGGGAEYSTTIPLTMVRELRVFDAQSVSETVLDR